MSKLVEFMVGVGAGAVEHLPILVILITYHDQLLSLHVHIL